MGWLDKAKLKLGIIDEDELAAIEAGDEAKAGARRKGPDGRPSLDGIEPPPQHSLDDALAAREAGDIDEMRRLLREMDRGGGLRLVMRAAAALEAGDDDELATLIPRVRGEQPAWRLPLQLAMALDDEARAAAFRRFAGEAGAPSWATAWASALSSDESERRSGLVELLFSDEALARTVAARELKIAGVEADAGAGKRYAAFSHGRDSLKRFGADQVATLFEHAHGELS
jgi:hypothetical protein